MAIPVYFHGPPSVKSGMGPLLIIKSELVVKRFPGLAAGLQLSEIEAFPFH